MVLNHIRHIGYQMTNLQGERLGTVRHIEIVKEELWVEISKAKLESAIRHSVSGMASLT